MGWGPTRKIRRSHHRRVYLLLNLGTSGAWHGGTAGEDPLLLGADQQNTRRTVASLHEMTARQALLRVTSWLVDVVLLTLSQTTAVVGIITWNNNVRLTAELHILQLPYAAIRSFCHGFPHNSRQMCHSRRCQNVDDTSDGQRVARADSRTTGSIHRFVSGQQAFCLAGCCGSEEGAGFSVGADLTTKSC